MNAKDETATPAEHSPPQPYGDLTELNTNGLILRLAGPEILRDIVEDYLGLLGTSAAIYEKNGDYATGIFSSGWCRKMDATSRAGCNTPDHRQALIGGQWHCHESCWKTSLQSMETGRPADLDCHGGIRIYAVPIVVRGAVVGSINFGYGDPPRDLEKLTEIEARYGIRVQELQSLAAEYSSRPAFIVEIAKARLATAAKLVGQIIERRLAEDEVKRLNQELDQRVVERTAQLEAAIKEMEAFSYSISHDLRAPLRAVDGYSRILIEDHGLSLDTEGHRVVNVIRSETQRMGHLIDDLLAYSRLSRSAMMDVEINMTEMVNLVLAEAAALEPQRALEVNLRSLPDAHGEPSMIRQVWRNLLSNAIKFAGLRPVARIDIGYGPTPHGDAFYVKDNGVGFDEKYKHKLFGVFQRLHSEEEFPGTGVGLALVQRIVQRHRGRVWAESQIDQGATFYFTLATRKETPNDPSHST